MDSTLSSRLTDDPRVDPDGTDTSRLFRLASILSVGSAVLYVGLLVPLATAAGVALICTPLLVAALFAWLRWRRTRLSLPRTALVASWATVAVVGLVAVVLGQGTYAAILSLMAVAICSLGVLAGRRAAVQAAVGSTLLVLMLLAAEGADWLPGVQAVAQEPLWLRLATLALLIGSSLGVSLLMSRITEHYVQAAQRREERFRTLLRMAADWYWELDHQFRFTPPDEKPARQDGPRQSSVAGRHLWELVSGELDDDALDTLRADLESHRPFTGVLMPWRDRGGRLRHLRISGEPRFGAQGVFLGYWGVGLDASPEIGARRAVAASENRLRELFDRTPSPLVLHRDGIVLDANPAAVELFEQDELDQMLERHLTDFYQPGPQVDLAMQRIASLESMPVGDGLPEATFVLQSPRGWRQVSVSSVRVDAHDGPATLSFFFDETERVRADAAISRSEGLLSHLVRSSPDAICLCELDTDRIVMVNEAYERLLGRPAADVIGRTSSDTGDWADPLERLRVIDMLRRRGRIDALPVRLAGKDGQEHLVMASGSAFEADQQRYMVLVARDIAASERTRLELEAILEQASIGIAFVRGDRFQHTNRRFDEMFGWAPGTLAGRPSSVVLGRELMAPAEAGEPTPAMVDVERPMQRADGSEFWCRLRAQALRAHHPSLAGTIWIAEDVSQRRRAEQALGAARDAAEAASLAKSRFLANTSHEIRTPLNGLLGLARLALDAPPDDSRRQAFLGQILESAQTLSRTISDILDLSKIEAGKLVIESTAFDLHALLRSLADEHRPLAGARDLDFVLEVDDDVPTWVTGDPLRLRQVLANYLGNALKFTARGRIGLEVRPVGGSLLHFGVADTGCGIDAGILPRLFKPFTQADESTTRRHGGTGLGLSICRELAVLLGGHVGVESRVDEGSRFWVELPLPATAAPPALAEAPRRDDLLRGARVLLVEDHPVNMLVAVAMLERWGIEVEQAGDGRAAVDAVHRADALGNPFDIVLMDVQMPQMSGHEATRELRRSHDARRLPIVALTAAALVNERELALDVGMDDFLTKPIDAERLHDTLERLLAPRRHGAH